MSTVLLLAPVDEVCTTKLVGEGWEPLVEEKVWVLGSDGEDGVLVDEGEGGVFIVGEDGCVLIVGEDEVADGTSVGDDCWAVDGLGGGALELPGKIVATTCPSAREKLMKPGSVQQLPDTRFLSQQYSPLWHRRIASLPAALFP